MKKSALMVLMAIAAMLAMGAGAGLYAADKPKAEMFKSSEFLTWKRDSQEFYIETSIGMSSLIAGQNDKTQSRCIDDWYYSDEKAGSDFVLETMKRFPTYHPRAVIMAALKKKCGGFQYKAN